MTIKEAALKSLDERKGLSNHLEVYNHIVEKGD